MMKQFSKFQKILLALFCLALTSSALTAQIDFQEITTAGLPPVSQGSSNFADVDNDGDTDIFVSGNLSGTFIARIYLNDGNGQFTLSSNALSGVAGESSSLFLDIDNDEDQDLIYFGWPQNFVDRQTKLYLNDGNGNFTEDTNVNFTGISRGDIAAADIDNDNDLDLVLTGEIGAVGVTELYINNGNGIYTLSAQNLQGVAVSSVEFADFDNDNDQDLLLFGFANPSFYGLLYLNDGNGNFSLQENSNIQGFGVSATTVADFNNDGFRDFVVSGRIDNNFTSATTYYQNNGDATFSVINGANLISVEEGSINSADFNNDGFEDIILTGIKKTEGLNFISETKLYFGQPNNSFIEINIPLLPNVNNGGHQLVTDVDNDADQDLVIIGKDFNSVQSFAKVFRNVPLVSCTAPTNLSASNLSTTSADISWDVAASLSGGYDYVLITDGTTPDASTTPTGNVATGVTTVNLTGLTPETSYEAYVRTNCGGGELSDWSAVLSFTTFSDPTTSPDFASLVDFYNATNGDSWTNNTNWLNPNVPLSQWHGLTVENNRVTQINLSFNVLIGVIPNSITNLTALETLVISSNNLAGNVPDFGLIPTMQTVNIINNDFSFIDFEPNFESNSSLSNFFYTSQNPRDTFIELEPVIGNNYEYTMTEVPGTDVQYQWYNEVYLALDPFTEPVAGATSNTIIFNNIQPDDLSTYFCVATSSLIPGLEIRRANVALFGPVSQEEKDALIAFYNALNGDNWSNNTNWLTAAPVRDWAGVFTTGNKVTGLSFFGDQNVSGQFPEEVGDLTNLVYLDFALNNITGNLPASFTNLTNLRRIRFQALAMNGTLPENIGNLTKLEEILIVFSGFTGSIPSSIGNLSNLRRFDMNGFPLGDNIPNNLSGTLPESLGNLTKLGLLRLDQNSLEGQIPASLANVGADNAFGLTFNLAFNNFSGPLPDWSGVPNPSSTQIFLEGNLFDFSDLEPLVNNGVTYSFFRYSPQRTNDVEETIDTGVGADITLNVNDTNLNRDIEDTAMNNEYQWFKDGAPISGANANSYTIINAQETDSGVYFCQITNDLLPDLIINRADITINIDATLSVDNFNSDAFSIYPNPTSNWLTIKTAGLSAASLKIIDINGKLLLEQQLVTNITAVDVQQLPTGIYLVTVTNNNATSTKRFIKQ